MDHSLAAQNYMKTFYKNYKNVLYFGYPNVQSLVCNEIAWLYLNTFVIGFRKKKKHLHYSIFKSLFISYACYTRITLYATTIGWRCVKTFVFTKREPTS